MTTIVDPIIVTTTWFGFVVHGDRFRKPVSIAATVSTAPG